MDNQFKYFFTPLKIVQITVPNRIVMTAMFAFLWEKGLAQRKNLPTILQRSSSVLNSPFVVSCIA